MLTPVARTVRTPRARTHRRSPGRNSPTGFTLLELIIVMAVLSILSAVSLPRVAGQLDGIAVRGAASDAEAMLESARQIALARSARSTVDIDTARAYFLLRVGNDTLARRDEATMHQVRFTASRTSVTYNQLGMGFGVSNLTLVITRGAAAETVVVSRLGRVRR